MTEIKTKYGSLYYEETPIDGYAILSSDEKVLFYVGDKSILNDFIYDIQHQETWSDFIQYLAEYSDQPIMYAPTLQELKNEYYQYNLETYEECADTKRECNKIIKDEYVIIGEHYMLLDYTELHWGK